MAPRGERAAERGGSGRREGRRGPRGGRAGERSGPGPRPRRSAESQRGGGEGLNWAGPGRTGRGAARGNGRSLPPRAPTAGSVSRDGGGSGRPRRRLPLPRKWKGAVAGRQSLEGPLGGARGREEPVSQCLFCSRPLVFFLSVRDPRHARLRHAP